MTFYDSTVPPVEAEMRKDWECGLLVRGLVVLDHVAFPGVPQLYSLLLLALPDFPWQS